MKLISHGFRRAGGIDHTYSKHYLKIRKMTRAQVHYDLLHNFVLMFCKNMGHFVVRSLNCGFSKGTLSITQCQGIVPCLPKADKPRHFLKNWRPITLLNTSYKIAAGSITNRCKTVLNKIIDFDQSGFVPGRFIGENTCLPYDIIQYAEENNLQLC